MKSQLKERKIKRRIYWSNKFTKKILPLHKHYTKSIVIRILNRIDRAINQIALRSKKAGIDFSLTIEKLRKLTYNYYGTHCIFCDRVLTIHNFVYDHVIPVAKGGASSIENMQLICKRCNNIKGSLTQENLFLLLKWLDTQPEQFKKDILTKLAGGRR